MATTVLTSTNVEQRGRSYLRHLGAVIGGYGYDKTSNRISLTTAAGTSTYAYPTTSYRLSSVGGLTRRYDRTGNTIGISSSAQDFFYDPAGRMSSVRRNGATVRNYQYNGKGERVRSFLGADSRYTLYDEAGHWIGDYSANGTPIQQAIWLDDLPVGLRNEASGALTYIEPDHLGSPPVVVDPVTDKAVWKWDLKGEAFGATAPEEDPDGDGTSFKLDMRFPGQRLDAATGVNYNYFRDYEPTTERYVQSDPIGLRGGISSYGYAGFSPLSASDFSGLACASYGGLTGCSYPGGPSFIVPTPIGWQDFVGNELLYHNYDIQRSLWCADADGVMNDLINHPTPSKNARPASSGGTTHNDAGVPGLPFSNFVTTYLTKDLKSGGALVVNITAPGSAFSPGYVARSVINEAAHTYGEGLSWMQADKMSSSALINKIVNEKVWGGQMQEFISENSKCGCRR